MSHTANGVTANYIWDINRSVPRVLQDGTNKYVYGLGLISATDGSGNQTFFTADGLGSTANLTSSVAAVTDTYSYDVFGAVRSHSGSSPNQRLFTGEQTDIATGDTQMQYLRARYYDPGSGTFLTRDPLTGQPTAPQTWNPYTYVRNNPTSRVDPTGRDSETLGIPRPCIKLVVGLLLEALAPGLLFTVPAPLFLPLEIMYVYIETFNATTELLEAYQEANRTGQSVSSLELASVITKALGGNEGLSQLLGVPAIANDFFNCARSSN
jgi:RHS repeat-associated protein